VNTALSTSPSIFDLYDSASKGQSFLLVTLSRLFNCQATSIETFRCTEDPFIRASITIKHDPQSYLDKQELPSSTQKKSDSLNAIVKHDGDVTALPFKSSNLVNCYLLIHHATQHNHSCSFTAEADELSSHVIEALNISYKITQQENDLKSIHYVLDHYPIAAVAIDECLNSVFTNQAAQRTLQKATAHTVTKQENLLQLCQPNSHATLKKALINSLNGNALKSRHLIIDFNKTPLTLIVTTTNTVPNVFRHVSRNTISWVYILNPDYTRSLKSHTGFQALGLSTAEVELACALFIGQSLNEIAELRCVSKQTVRKQLQSILRKTDCENQESLMIFFFESYIHYGLTH
jgi:DNA-binding CsgD family transcriptional regulator